MAAKRKAKQRLDSSDEQSLVGDLTSLIREYDLQTVASTLGHIASEQESLAEEISRACEELADAADTLAHLGKAGQ